MEEIKLSALLIPKLQQYYKDYVANKYTYYVNAGGRCSTKSSAVSLVVMLDMKEHTEGHTVVFRNTQAQLRQSVAEQFQWAINTLGLAKEWELKLAPKLKFINKFTGQEIRFLGYDNAANVTKGQKFVKGYVRNIVYEEGDQFRSFEEIKVGLASLMRTNGYNDAVHKVNIVYNPPKSATAWINNPDIWDYTTTGYYKTTYLDVPNGWLSPQYLKLIEYTKETNPEQYRWEYLGEIVGNGSQVFKNLTIREIKDDEYEQYTDKIYAGIDFGFKKDPTTWVLFHYNGKKLVFLKEYYKHGVFMEDVAEHIKQQGCANITTICDSAEPREIAELRRMGINTHPSRKGKGSRHKGIKLLQEVEEIVIDPRRTPHMGTEWSAYSYKKNAAGEELNEFQDDNDHTIDPVKYFMLLWRR